MKTDLFDYDLDRYVNYAKTFPLLTSKEERKLLLVMKKNSLRIKDREDARAKLINHNLLLVVHYAFKYVKYKIPIMDLISAGNFGLITAIDRFNCRNKNRLSTYAVNYIQVNMTKIVREYRNGMHIPSNVLSDINNYKKMKESEMSNADIKNNLHIGKRAFENILSASVPFYSLESNFITKYDEKPASLRDVVPDPKSLPPDKIMENNEITKTISDVIDQLKPIHRDIIKGRFLNVKKDTLCELGRKHHCTGEAIRIQERKALRQLQIKLKKNSYYNDIKRIILHE